MAFQRPTLAELVDRIEQDFISRLELVGPILRRSVVKALARVVSGAAHMLHGHLEFLSKQVFPDQSESEFLTRQGSLFGLTRTAPGFAKGTIIVSGNGGIGTFVNIGTVFQRSSDGAEYTSDGIVALVGSLDWAPTTGYTVGQLKVNGENLYYCATAGTSAGSGGPTGVEDAITDGTCVWTYISPSAAAIAVPITASIAGEDSTLVYGDVLVFESPLSNIFTETKAVASTQDGTASEEDADFRVRLLERMRNPPHGGNETDYIAWAKEVSGVTRAWCSPLELGAGTVVVRFVRDNDTDLIPSGGEVTEVQDYIDALRPVTADLTVLAPVSNPLNFTIHISPDTTTTRAAVQAELEDLISREAEPGGTLLLSDIETAVRTADGITDRIVTLPAADVTEVTGSLSTMGIITWT